MQNHMERKRPLYCCHGHTRRSLHTQKSRFGTHSGMYSQVRGVVLLSSNGCFLSVLRVLLVPLIALTRILYHNGWKMSTQFCKYLRKSSFRNKGRHLPWRRPCKIIFSQMRTAPRGYIPHPHRKYPCRGSLRSARSVFQGKGHRASPALRHS